MLHLGATTCQSIGSRVLGGVGAECCPGHTLQSAVALKLGFGWAPCLFYHYYFLLLNLARPPWGQTREFGLVQAAVRRGDPAGPRQWSGRGAAVGLRVPPEVGRV